MEYGVLSKEWHGIKNQPHSHSSDYRPHPIHTKHIPIPNPVDSCIQLWNLQVRVMQHYICMQTNTSYYQSLNLLTKASSY